jgi:hypothetical protein
VTAVPRDVTGTMGGEGWGPTWPVVEESGSLRAQEMGVGVDQERRQVAREEGCGRGGGIGVGLGATEEGRGGRAGYASGARCEIRWMRCDD